MIFESMMLKIFLYLMDSNSMEMVFEYFQNDFQKDLLN
jgi:hypothetical protein